ncbi:MAG: 3-oxoacyl-[acyl-carrier protein] reductase [Halieaceae bacterium]|jgi:3-oxoacyl-[acyl-carrier protein] reductase
MTITTDHSGKVALVTGASSGIGRGVAIALANAGCHVFINFPPGEGSEAAASVQASIQADGGKASLAPADVSNETDVKKMFDSLMTEANRLDILINNAGIARSAPIEDITLADWQAVMGVHVTGTFLCTRAALPIMYQQDSGRIINTASQLAYKGAPGFAHYTAAKGAILSFTRTLTLEIGSRNISANCVAPGATMTPILEDVPKEILDGIRQAIPRGKLAEVDDIVGTYIFLASDGAAHFRGQCLSPNGGDVFL